MAFPEDPLPVRVELDLGDRWEDITSRWKGDRIVLTRGQRGEAPRVDPSTCTLTLNNADGRFTWRNPVGPYYGRIGRNTPLRVSIGTGPSYLTVPGGTARASTPHVPALGITGDLDLRLDLAPSTWRPSVTTELAAKYTVLANQRSWLLMLDTGGIVQWRWSPDGVNIQTVYSTAPVPVPESGRQALRVTLDVDNGTGGHTVRFYTAQTMAGPWTQLGNPVTGTGVTTIHAGTEPVHIGDAGGIGFTAMSGRVYAAEIRNGIGGTVVAALDAAGQAPGTTAWTDRAGRAWAVEGGAKLENWQPRFIGEVTTWPTTWGPSGLDAEATITASGILRRLGQGAKPLESALRRRIPTFNPGAYWPCEDGQGATRLYSPVPGVRPARFADVSLATDDSLPGSGPVLTFGAAAYLTAPVPAMPSGEWHVEFAYKLDAHPQIINWFLDVHTSGSARILHVTLLLSGSIQIIREDDEGRTELLLFGDAPGFTGGWKRLQLFARPSGGNTELTLRWITVGGSALQYVVTYAGAPGRVTSVVKPSENGGDLRGMAFGHLAVFPAADVPAFNWADHGFTNESAHERITRLCAEEGVPVRIDAPEGSAAMGPQRPGTLLELLEECAKADAGLLAEDPDRIGLLYRARTTVYNQPVALPLRYGQGREVQPPLPVVDDDLHVRNDITVVRPDGSPARAVLEEGPLSVLSPPLGVGRYDESDTVNVATDEQLAEHAGWALHLGTVDEPRYPQVNLDLARAPHLIPVVMALRLRDRLTITGAPSQWAPGAIDQLVQGWMETLGVRTWAMQLDCTPASPWTVGVVEDEELGRVDTDGSVLAASVDADATAVDVFATVGPPWTTDPTDYPLDIRVGGEVMTVQSVTRVHDSFTRTVTGGWGTSTSGHPWAVASGPVADRSVNGSAGVISLASSPATPRFQYIDGPVVDVELLARTSTNQITTGAGSLPALILRYADVNTYYRARIHFDPGGAMSASITQGVTQIGPTVALPYTYTAGSWWWMRGRLVGHRMWLRVWPDGHPEPSGWHLDREATVDTIPSGSVGLSASTFGSNTNVGLTISFDDFQIVSPQTMTVVRAVNGVRKPQSAGTDVRLAHPTIVAL